MPILNVCIEKLVFGSANWLCCLFLQPGTLKSTQIYIRMQLDLVLRQNSIFGLESAKGNNSHMGTMHKLSLVFLIY